MADTGTNPVSSKTESEQSMLRTLIAQLIPKIVDVAVRITPDNIQQAIVNAGGLMNYIMPIISGTFGVGMVKTLETLLAGKSWADQLIDPVDDFRAAFFAEYTNRIRHNLTEHPKLKDQPGVVETLLPPSMVIIDRHDPDHYHHRDCHVVPRTKKIPGKAGNGKDQKGTPDREEPRTDLQTVRIETILRTSCRVANCCAGYFDQDIDKMLANATKLLKAAGPKEKKPGNSFTTFLGRALLGKIEGVDVAKASALQKLFYQLTPYETGHLHEIDNDLEFVALCSANNLDEFRRLIKASRDRKFTTALADMVGVPAGAVQNTVHAVKAAAGKVAAVIPGIPGKIEAYAAQLRADDISLATAMRDARQKRKQERAARRAGKA